MHVFANFCTFLFYVFPFNHWPIMKSAMVNNVLSIWSMVSLGIATKSSLFFFTLKIPLIIHQQRLESRMNMHN